MNEETRPKPETIVELMRKSKFDSMKKKFDYVDSSVDAVLANAKNDDILALTITVDNPVHVISAEITTTDHFLKEAFS